MKRPSPREIDKRLKEAMEALQDGNAFYANQGKAVGELMELNIGDSSEVWDLIIQLLNEIKVENYTGQYPPKVNYEPQGKGKLERFHRTFREQFLSELDTAWEELIESINLIKQKQDIKN